MEQIQVEKLVAKTFQVSESIKTLRTNILFSGTEIKTVALTSNSANAGKSTVSLQLAVSMAQSGKRVLLVDVDLRNSAMLKRLKPKGNISGLSHYLSGMASREELVQQTDVENLSLIFSGPRVPNAAELLGGKKFFDLIRDLRPEYDYIFMDAAPLGQVIDCAVISPCVDGVLIVVDVMNNSSKMEQRVVAQLEKAGTRILGVVLNRVDFNDKHGYYGKAYGYAYGYVYGYDQTEK